ncbi:glycoside hydrolase family 3 protein [Kitasatospora phosalacinea]|uniref:glycoside hydrolase family 3 protein n=1 Tax=Kitasatospora phosalacinea TaxID=2065 RepID=UPI00052407CA|nr:glycoside hydrolase family 3 protein [Kitasatospora phosalacinea]
MSSPSPSAAATPAERYPFHDSALPLDKRVDDLLSRLSPAERLSMLHQYAPAVPRLGIGAFRTGAEALHGVSWLGVATAFPQAVGLGASWDEELVREVAEAVSTELRAFHHHRPAAIAPDRGPNSLQAWAPVLNLLRDPRWGRNEEGYSEDPVHTARLGEAFCRGLAGDHPTYLRAAPVLKHFLAYNNEDDRCTTSSGVRPRVLHEYDLAAFKPAIASGAATGVMAAYNLVNGRPCHVSPLLEAELRRWAEPTGRELFVVSDAEAPSNLVDPEHYFDDHAEGHAAALKAGIDSFTDHGEDSETVIGRLREALERGLIDQEDVDLAVRRQFELRFRMGEFDPELDPYAKIGAEVVDSAPHRALARRAAAESTVLLKNTGLLPLTDPTKKIAVIGPHGDALFEDWYSGTLPYAVTVADGLRARLVPAGGELAVHEGLDRILLRAATSGEPLNGTAFDLGDWGLGVLTLRAVDSGGFLSVKEDGSLVADQAVIKSWDVHETFRLVEADGGALLLQSVLTGRYAAAGADGAVKVTAEDAAGAERFTRELLRDGRAEAVAAAADADLAVVVLGNHPLIHGRETLDRQGLALPPAQEELLKAVAAVRPETALIVMSSYPYAVDWADEHLPAVLWTSHGGQETGHALADVLFGDADPAGRLPQTWYRGDDELPHPLDYDIIQAGWTYQYHQAPARYPFGHGLSYGTFRYGGLEVEEGVLGQDGTVRAALTVSNTGTRGGTEVVQLYVRPLEARYQAPRRRLADFRKVTLAPGQSRRLVFDLPVAAHLAHWDVATGTFTVDPGSYQLLAAASAEDVRATAQVTVEGPAPAPRAVLGRRTGAADFDAHRGIALVDATRTDGDAVTPAGSDAELVFSTVELTGSREVSAEVALDGALDGPDAAELEFSVDGRVLATLAVPPTGGRYAWTTVTAALDGAPHGVHDLRVALRGPVRLAAFTVA